MVVARRMVTVKGRWRMGDGDGEVETPVSGEGGGALSDNKVGFCWWLAASFARKTVRLPGLVAIYSGVEYTAYLTCGRVCYSPEAGGFGAC